MLTWRPGHRLVVMDGRGPGWLWMALPRGVAAPGFRGGGRGWMLRGLARRDKFCGRDSSMSRSGPVIILLICLPLFPAHCLVFPLFLLFLSVSYLCLALCLCLSLSSSF